MCWRQYAGLILLLRSHNQMQLQPPHCSTHTSTCPICQVQKQTPHMQQAVSILITPTLLTALLSFSVHLLQSNRPTATPLVGPETYTAPPLTAELLVKVVPAAVTALSPATEAEMPPPLPLEACGTQQYRHAHTLNTDCAVRAYLHPTLECHKSGWLHWLNSLSVSVSLSLSLSLSVSTHHGTLLFWGL
jgi:hypothetical protein